MGNRFLVLGLMLASCGGESGEGENDRRGSSGGTNMEAEDNQNDQHEANAPSQVRACAVTDCHSELDTYVRSDVGPGAASPTFETTECTNGGIQDEDGNALNGPYCICRTHDDGVFTVSTLEGGCAVRGHTRVCVMEHGEAVCDPEVDDVCDETCDELEARLAAEAETELAFTLQSAICTERETAEGPVAACTGVVEIDGTCYGLAPTIQWNDERACEATDAPAQDAGS